MTKTEIFNKSNSYKIEYNINNSKVCKNNQTLIFLKRFKNFFKVREEKTNILKRNLLIGASISSLIALVDLVLTPYISIPFFIISGIIWERFFFFNYVNKKFKKVSRIFEKLMLSINDKQNLCLIEKEHIMAQIISLEKEIPDEIKDSLAIFEVEEVEEPTNNVNSEIYAL